MFKKNSPRRLTPRHFKEPVSEPVQELPPNCNSGFPENKNTLISELEKSLENLQEAIRRGERAVSKAAAAFGSDGDGDNDD